MSKGLSYYHPSTVVFVDDQQTFLNAVKSRLPQEMLALFFNSAETALSKILDESPRYEKSQCVLEIKDDLEIDSSNDNDALFSLKLGEVCEIAYNSQRFSEISVVIVDRIMPGLDGINFCRKLANHPVKKIMLTPSKDRKIAIEAFNEGIIDFFILKDSPDLISQLTTTIENLQREYFSSLTRCTFGRALEIAAPMVTNDSIISFLHHKMAELNAVEFYLLDKWGSVLFIKYDGTPVTLAISSDKTLDTFAAIAEEHEEKSISEMLLKRNKLLFFPSEMDRMCSIREWDNFLFEATLIPEQSNLFYSVIEAHHHQPVNVEKIYSQEIYME